ncbi:MAG: DUF1542 domain-containing protein, partial [Lachnospiraceae bacterium]|nr:DUF1542 domain-containing protein [Lachnospiraceae bacterium]
AMTASTLNGVGLDTVYAESVTSATYADSGNTSILTAPQVVKEITADSATSFTASWTAVEGAASYEVKVGLQYDVPDSEAETILKENINDTSCKIVNLQGGTTYYYLVRAIDSSGNAGAWSETVTVLPRKFTIEVSEGDGYRVIYKTMNPLPFKEDYTFEIVAESNDYSLENLEAEITGGISLEATKSINDGEKRRGYEFVIRRVVADTYVIISGVYDLKPLKTEARDKIEAVVEECGTIIDGLKSLSDVDKQKLADNVTAAEEKAKQAVHDAVTEGTVKAAGEDSVKDIRKVVADIVPDAIENIGEVSYDQECKNKIDDAQELFDFLTEEEKAHVQEDTVAKLQKALDDYAELENAAKLQEARDAAKQEVDSAAADVEKRIDSLTNAPDARKAEWKESLSGKADTGKNAIDTADTEDAVNAEKDKAIADINTIFTDIAKALIDEIGEVKNDDAAIEKIDAAKEAFDKLTDEEKEKIPEEDKKKLTEAEKEYNDLVAAKELQRAKQEAKKAVENAVEEVGKGIDSFTKMPDAQKKVWKDEAAAKAAAGNGEIDTENTVEGVEIARDNTVSSIRDIIISIAKDLINEIGEVKNDDASKDKIDAAKEAFDKLTDEEKEKIPEEDKKKLTDAEEKYSALVVAKELERAKQEAKKAVENAVEEAGKGIDSFEKVPDAQKKAWKNEAAAKAETGNVKIDAEDTVKGVETARDNAVSSIRDIIINIAKDLINEIGEVKKDDSSKDKIDAAKEAFDKLTDEEKEKIPEEDKKKLTEAEKEYNALEDAEELKKQKEDAGKDVGNAVDTVNKRIDALKNASDEQKKAWKDEVAAKETAGNKEIDAANSAKEVKAAKDNTVSAIHNIYIDIIKKLINNIGEVKNDDASKKKIETAKEAFDSLTDTEKQKIPADLTKKLEEAQTQYAALVQGKGDTGEANTNTIPLQEAEKQIVNANTDKNDPSNSQFSKLRLKATGAKKSIKLSWTKVN